MAEFPGPSQPEFDAHLADTTSVHGIPDTSKLAVFDAGNPAGSVISAVTGAPVSVVSDASGVTSTPAGNIAATNVQAAINELDTEKAPLASPAFTGTPTAPTPAQGDNDTSIATTAYVQTEAGLLVPKSLVDAKGDLLVGSADNTVIRKAVGSAGATLAVDTSATDGLAWAMLPPQAPPVAGRYLLAPFQNTSTLANPTTGTTVYVPMFVTQRATFDRIAINVTAAASTGTVQLGIYGLASGGFLPGPRILDAGTVDPTSIGAKEAIISQSVAPGLYWVAAYFNYTGSLTITSYSEPMFPLGRPSVTGTPAFGLQATETLPSTASATPSFVAAAPYIILRAA